LPEDYLNLPANHRQSILRLPNVTADDIAAVYQQWTELRVSATLRRGPVAEPEQVAAGIRASAANG
jgi:hypothetical protein